MYHPQNSIELFYTDCPDGRRGVVQTPSYRLENNTNKMHVTKNNNDNH